MSNNVIRSKMSRTQYISALRAKINEESQTKGSTKQDDERYWKPELDKVGTGNAIIRFLPCRREEGFPYVKLFTHGFQGPQGKWFIDNCPTSIEQECPACKANSALWQSGDDAKKKIAQSRKRKLNYVSNILVVNDPKHPEHNGKVFLYRYGKKIFEKIKDLVTPPPDFPDMVSIDPFDMFEGANFKLRVTRQDGFPNYDKSSFDNQSAVGDEDRCAMIEEQLYSLTEVLDPKHFKTYADLEKRFNQVTGGAVAPVAETTDEKPSLEEAPSDDDLPVVVAKPKSRPPAPKVAKAPEVGDDDIDFEKIVSDAAQKASQ